MSKLRDQIVGRLLVEHQMLDGGLVTQLLAETNRLQGEGTSMPLARLLIQHNLVEAPALSDLLRESESFVIHCGSCNDSWSLDSAKGLICPGCSTGAQIRRTSQRLKTSPAPPSAQLQPVSDGRPSDRFTPPLATPDAATPLRPVSSKDIAAHMDSAGSSRRHRGVEAASPEPSKGGHPGSDGSGAASVPRSLGPYDLDREIGRGGMGVVFLARQRNLDRNVALKVLLAGPFATEQQQRRFKREAEIACQLRHPGIVSILDFGDEDGLHYMAMDYVDGQQLSDLIRTRTLDVRAALRLATDMARALDYAHAQGVIHRDIKPANIIVDDEGKPHITDFGLARRIDGNEMSALTQTGKVIGTPFYMSPEQAQARRDVDGRTDIYSLGLVLYEMLAFRRPFQADSSFSLIEKILHEDPPSLESLAAQQGRRIDRDIDTICHKALAKRPETRYATAGAMADDLDRYLAGDIITARPSRAHERLLRRLRRHQTTIAAAAVSGCVVLFLSQVFGPSTGLEGNQPTTRNSTKKAISTPAPPPQQKPVDEAWVALRAADRQLRIAQTTSNAAERRDAISRALVHAEEASPALDDDAALALVRARALQMREDYPQAAEHFVLAYELEPECTYAPYQQARIVISLEGRAAAGLEILRDLALQAPPFGVPSDSKAPPSAQARFGLPAQVPQVPAVVFEMLADAAIRVLDDGDLEGADERILEAHRLAPDCEAVYLLEGFIATQPGRDNFQAAFDSIQKALVVNPRSVQALLNKASVLIGLGRASEALGVLDHALVIEPGASRILRDRAKLLTLDGRYSQAAEDLASAIKTRPLTGEEGVAESLLLSDFLRRSGKHDEALRVCENIRRENPSSPDGWLAVSRLHRRNDDIEQAVGTLRSAINADIDEIERIYVELSLIYETAKRLEDVENVAKDFVRRYPGNSQALHMRATAAALRGRLDEAQRGFEEVVELDPSSVQSWTNLAKTWLQKGNLQMTSEIANRMLAAQPRSPEAWQTATRIRSSCGDAAGALAAAERAWELKANDPETAKLLAVLYAESGRPTEARDRLQDSLRVDPENVDLMLMMGQLMESVNPIQAERTFLRAAATRPRNPEPLFYLSMLLFNQDRLEDARKAIDRAVAIRSNSGDLIAHQGIISLRQGDARSGRRLIRRGLELGIEAVPRHSALYFLGLAEEKLGAAVEAEKQMREALRVMPGFTPARDWLQLNGKSPDPPESTKPPGG